VVAIGECGLDYWRRPKTEAKKEIFKKEQIDVFLRQIDLAEESGLPMIIHCREAFPEMMEVLKGRSVKGVIHCFTGTLKEAEKFISLGFLVGMNGIIFKTGLKEVIANVPLDKMLVETDCPYLSPPGLQEKRNDPFSVRYVIREIAMIRGTEDAIIAGATADNARKLFLI